MKIIAAIALALTLTGCVAAAEQAALNQAQPEDFGPMPNAEPLIERWLMANLRDPASLKDLTFTPPVRDTEIIGLVYGGGFWYGWKSCATYRAKNAFGGYVIETKTFYMRDGAVVEVRKWCDA